MKKLFTLIISAAIAGCATGPTSKTQSGKWSENFQVLGSYRQMTFDGPRAGEGYFSKNGEWMIFQSEREPGNPFYQIYIQDLKSKKTWRVSPGTGKTTCSWIAPDMKSVIFSSTHGDKESLAKQKAELDFRASGQTKRYSWDYDPEYEIYSADIKGGNLRNLTRTKGYDAEASISPDGKWIAFASNRSAYEGQLSAEDKAKLEMDPSAFMDLYIMDRNGGNVRRLTNTIGYDGGPFFSPDSERIIWRRFSPDGHSAEVYTMKIDGSDVKQITRLNAMSWAPFYHPSGDYIVFTSNVLGYHNFELFVVDRDGKNNPIRITNLDGFDGLPVFTPDGKNLTWNRKLSEKESQIVIAEFNDQKIRELLGLPKKAPQQKDLSPKYAVDDLRSVVTYLASEELQGRATGSDGEAKMSQMVAQMWSDLGLRSPLKTEKLWQAFPFPKEARIGSQNELTLINSSQKSLTIKTDWLPVAFSKRGEVAASNVVFVGYGIKAEATQNFPAYNSYEGLDVKDKWVVLFRYAPENIDKNYRAHLLRYSRLEHKAILARDLGAKGVIFVSGPNSGVKEELIPFKGRSHADLGIHAVSVSDNTIQNLLNAQNKKLKDLQNTLDKGEKIAGFEISNVKFSANIHIIHEIGTGRNTLAMIPGTTGTKDTIVVGAHGDHLGNEPTEGSLRTSQDKSSIHYGADDNASGVAAVLRISTKLAEDYKKGSFRPKKNIVFAIWSGEELGNLGSNYFLNKIKEAKVKPVAYVNLDMVGRWPTNPSDESLLALNIQGVASGKEWKNQIERLGLTFPVQLQDDPYLPTDAMSFYVEKVPVINFFTGAHADYHTPRDTADRINYVGVLKVAETVEALVRNLSSETTNLTYVDVPKASTETRRGFRIFLGTIPDYTKDSKDGVHINGVITGGPADKAGLKGGDIIVEFSKQKISTIHDYVFTLETVKPNEPTTIVVLRNGKREEVSITPQAKE